MRLGNCALVAAFVLICAVDGDAGAKPAKKVKISATASKSDAGGNQMVIITLDIDKGWHTYANPVDNADLRGAQIQLKVRAKEPLQGVDVKFPPGTPYSDKTLGNFKAYEGRVNIKVAISRAVGDTGPLEVELKAQVCNDNTCIPVLEKLTVK